MLHTSQTGFRQIHRDKGLKTGTKVAADSLRLRHDSESGLSSVLGAEFDKELDSNSSFRRTVSVWGTLVRGTCPSTGAQGPPLQGPLCSPPRTPSTGAPSGPSGPPSARAPFCSPPPPRAPRAARVQAGTFGPSSCIALRETSWFVKITSRFGLNFCF